ncbi:MAG TPA: serine--tRNA ligase [Buchnera sp. (in: enterobacteria)]|nr:serine--tRNA ligase [Buchnera sp. (in: enterobacteria)]
MLDPKLLRNMPKLVAKKLEKRGFILDIEFMCSMEQDRKILQIKTEKLQAKQNTLSKLIGKYKHCKTYVILLKAEGYNINKKLYLAKSELTILKEKIHNFSINIPNIVSDDVPDGENSINNRDISYWGILKNYNFLIKDHIELGNDLNGFDWKAAARLSGSRFVVIKDQLALLHRALGQFMLDTHIFKHGYTEVHVPYLVNEKSLYGTGQLPKFKDDLFYTYQHSIEKNKNRYILIPTAEVPLTNLLRNEILKEKDLPIKLTALTPCFRSESSAYGKDTRGLIRMHQFDKVEIIQIAKPEYSMHVLEKLTAHAEKILQLLQLPYRKVLLCAGDMSFSATKTYDLEVWFPSQKIYREVSSCSNMSDFQARRINARYRTTYDKKISFIHTINGSGLAIGRTLAAILENYQLSDGTVAVPEVLQIPYMKGLKVLC